MLVGVWVIVLVGVNVLVGVKVLVGVTVGVGVGDTHVPSPIELMVTPDSVMLLKNPNVAGIKQTHSKFMIEPDGKGTSI